jgi:hypothetical protein
MNEHEDNHHLTETSVAKQLAIGLVDFMLSVMILWSVVTYQWPGWLYHFFNSLQVNNTLIVIGIHFLVRFITIMAWSTTPGMALLHVVLLDHEEKPLRFKARLLASFFILYRGVDYYNRW